MSTIVMHERHSIDKTPPERMRVTFRGGPHAGQTRPMARNPHALQQLVLELGQSEAATDAEDCQIESLQVTSLVRKLQADPK